MPMISSPTARATSMSAALRRNRSPSAASQAAQFKQGKTISGRGIFLIPLSNVNPETGEMSPVTAYAHACLVVDLEVCDETGDVKVNKLTSAYELGRALNPKMVEQQLVGGAWMGMSHALYETPEPYYPNPEHGGRDFNEYLLPGPVDIAPHDIAVWATGARRPFAPRVKRDMRHPVMPGSPTRSSPPSA